MGDPWFEFYIEFVDKGLRKERERLRNCGKKLKHEKQTPNDKYLRLKSLAPSQVWPRTALQAVSECPLRR